MARPGKLDQRITLQANTTVSDGGGGQIDGWADFASSPAVWANVLPLAGGEGSDAGGTNANGRYLVTIRNRSDISEADRMVWDGSGYNIRNVRREGVRAMYLKFEAERGVAS